MPTPPTPPAPPPVKKGTPRVHIDADRPGVRLLRIDGVISDREGEALLVRTACEAPCNRVVEGKKGQSFFVGAPGMIPSRGFGLEDYQDDVTVRVDGGSMAARQIGYLASALGGVAMAGGGIMLAYGYGGSDSRLSNGRIVEGRNEALTTGGFITLGAGAAVLATGIVLAVTNSTSIEIVPTTQRSTGLKFERGHFVF
ncbi:uncharacterized protein CMC5_020440 [Chondromyces crocatus]|uniref:Uncharacterized protein n=2 Tax=Chondromyces crocatus TaxID=52 RepID=A0A0K1EAJ0_CHOCO|nr:uncharacterized protein CMC5_020440 [Chondromyces crocatus]